MNIACKLWTVAGLAALTISVLAAAPAQAQCFYHRNQMRHAAHLDRTAARAAFSGNYRRAARLRRQANHLRCDARRGY